MFFSQKYMQTVSTCLCTMSICSYMYASIFLIFFWATLSPFLVLACTCTHFLTFPRSLPYPLVCISRANILDIYFLISICW